MRKNILTSLKEDLQVIGITRLLGEDVETPLDEVKVVKTKRSTAGQRTKWRKAAKGRRSKMKKYRKTAKFKKRSLKLKKLHARKGDAGTRKRFSLESREIDPRAILAEGKKLAGSLAEARTSKQVKAFANMSLAADDLFTNLQEASEELEDQDVTDAAEAMQQLASDTADIAEALQKGKELDGDQLEEAFQEALGYLVDGLDFYDGLLEACSDDEDDDDEDEDEDEDDDEDGEEDDDDDIEVESVSKKKSR